MFLLKGLTYQTHANLGVGLLAHGPYWGTCMNQLRDLGPVPRGRPIGPESSPEAAASGCPEIYPLKIRLPRNIPSQNQAAQLP